MAGHTTSTSLITYYFPDGYAYVVRDVAIWLDVASTANGVFWRGSENQVLAAFFPGTGLYENESFHWSGRQVFAGGESMSLDPQLLGIGNFHYGVSGYQLYLP
jgi:hypothetical protein